MKRINTLLLVFILTSILFFSFPSIYSKNTNENQKISATFDLLIIAPEKYQISIQSLIDHKHEFNITTTLTTTEYIFDNFPGRDQQEKIKYCIKQTYDESDISFVLLIGDFKDIPVRYIHNTDEFDFFDIKSYFITKLLQFSSNLDRKWCFQFF